MFRNYIKIAFRYLLRNKVLAVINTFGLAVGMAACFTIMQYVHFEMSYDKFHKNAKDIYRVNLYWGKTHMATNHPAAGPALKADFPEVIEYARAAPLSLFTPNVTLSYVDENGNEKAYNEDRIYLVDSTFLSMFSFPFIYGDSRSIFPTSNSMIISQSLAEKFFGNENSLGKQIYVNGYQPFIISGVFEDIPENSHIKFNVLAQLNIGDYNNSWEWPEYYTYIQLTPGTDIHELESKMPAFITKYLGELMKRYESEMSFRFQPLADIHLKSPNLNKEKEVHGNEKSVYFLLIIGILVLVIAWINYINLSTSRSIARAREVGLRKLVGASKRQLVVQFLFESTIMNLAALVLAFFILLSVLPYFNQLSGKNIGSSITEMSLISDPLFWITLACVFFAGSFLAGAYPAFILSSFRSIKVLKGTFGGSGSGILLRKMLVGIQFAISIALIAGTFIVMKQVSFMRDRDLGYAKDQLLVIKAPNVFDSTIMNKFEVFRTELLRNADINSATASSDIPGRLIPIINGVRLTGEDIKENSEFYFVSVDHYYLETYGLKIIAGRNFRIDEQTNPFAGLVNPVILNEKAVRLMGFTNPEECLNKPVTFKLGPTERAGEIIGVVNDYHQRSLKDDIDPLMFYSTPFPDRRYYSINLNTAHIHETVNFIENQYKNLFLGNPFDYFFLDDYFDQQYAADKQFGKVFGVFSIIAIIVACLGLYGLSSFMVTQRTKEIAIRKVLGATITGMLVLLTTDFIKLIILANLIVLPLLYLPVKGWLNNFAFHVNMNLMMVLIPSAILLMIVLFTTSFQTIRTSLVNPVKALRYE